MTENRTELIEKFNDANGTSCRSITGIYNIHKSAPGAAKALKVSEASIRNWVSAEGGKLMPRGGGHKTVTLFDIVDRIDPNVLKDIGPSELAELTGYDHSWCSRVLAWRNK